MQSDRAKNQPQGQNDQRQRQEVQDATQRDQTELTSFSTRFTSRPETVQTTYSKPDMPWFPLTIPSAYSPFSYATQTQIISIIDNLVFSSVDSYSIQKDFC
jgi:hypothetical protein